MKTIYKYPIPVVDRYRIEMPLGAQVLTVQAQGDAVCLWALVDPYRPASARWFRIYGTGHTVDDSPGRYVGTFQIHGGSLVFHVFEEPAASPPGESTPECHRGGVSPTEGGR